MDQPNDNKSLKEVRKELRNNPSDPENEKDTSYSHGYTEQKTNATQPPPVLGGGEGGGRNGYKLTKLGWIPEQWEIKSLEDFSVSMKSGLSRKLSNDDIGLPVLRSNNLINNIVNFCDIKYWYFIDTQGANTKNYFLKDGDILVNFINSLAQIGKCAYFQNTLNRDVIYTTNILALRLNKKICIPSYFLDYTLTNRYKNFVQSITKPAVNQASFTTKDFKRLLIPLPPLPEQQKIAIILSTWDRAISKTEQLIVKKQERKKGLMQQLLTGKKRFGEFVKSYKMKETKLGWIPEDWEVIKLGDEVKKVGSGKTPKGGQTVYKNSGRPLVRSQNVGWGTLILKDIAFIDEKMHASFKSTELKEKDVLLNITGASIGRSALVTEQIVGGNVNQHVCIIRLNNNIEPKYLISYLLSERGQNQIDSFQAGGNRQGLNFDQIKSFPIPIPIRHEQEKIASFLSKADKEITFLQNQQAKLKEQKKGLMQKLLTGEVRVKLNKHVQSK